MMITIIVNRSYTKTVDVECTCIFVELLKLLYRKLRWEVHLGIYRGQSGRGWFFSERFGFPVTVNLRLFIQVSLTPCNPCSWQHHLIKHFKKTEQLRPFFPVTLRWPVRGVKLQRFLNLWNKNQLMSLFQFYLYIAGSLHVSGPQAHPQESSHSCSHNHWFSVCIALAMCSVCCGRSW